MNYKLQPKFKITLRVTACVVYLTDQILSAGKYRLGFFYSKMWPAAVYQPLRYPISSAAAFSPYFVG